MRERRSQKKSTETSEECDARTNRENERKREYRSRQKQQAEQERDNDNVPDDDNNDNVPDDDNVLIQLSAMIISVEQHRILMKF